MITAIQDTIKRLIGLSAQGKTSEQIAQDLGAVLHAMDAVQTELTDVYKKLEAVKAERDEWRKDVEHWTAKYAKLEARLAAAEADVNVQRMHGDMTRELLDAEKVHTADLQKQLEHASKPLLAETDLVKFYGDQMKEYRDNAIASRQRAETAETKLAALTQMLDTVKHYLIAHKHDELAAKLLAQFETLDKPQQG